MIRKDLMLMFNSSFQNLTNMRFHIDKANEKAYNKTVERIIKKLSRMAVFFVPFFRVRAYYNSYSSVFQYKNSRN